MTHILTGVDCARTRLAGLEEAILHRIDASAPLTDNGRRYRSFTAVELCREFLEIRGCNTRGMDRLQVAGAALQFRSDQTSADFSSLIANVANKRLRRSYEENPGTYKAWARRAPNAPDFKDINVAQLSAMPDLLQVTEHGEFKYGSLTDSGATYRLLTYGRIVPFSRQLIINDDLRAFDRAVTAFGAAAMRLENRVVYAELTANPVLGDGVQLFHASHGNLKTGALSALSATAMGDARASMRLQTGLQGELLNLPPRFLIVPAALEQTAYQLTSASYVPATTSAVNEFRQGGRTAVEPVVEPVLDAASSAAWYMAAASAAVDTVEFCYLDGADGPLISSEMKFERDGLQLRCRHDFAAKAVDFRGLFRSQGS